MEFTIKPKQPPKTKMEIRDKAILLLDKMAFEVSKKKHPNFPDKYIPRTKYEDSSANGLTKCIIDFIGFVGGFATRQQSQGQYRSNLGKWTRSNGRKGISDINCVIHGKYIAIEVKIGPDKLSEDQIEVMNDIRQAGGVYMVAKTFKGFLVEVFTNLLSEEEKLRIITQLNNLMITEDDLHKAITN